MTIEITPEREAELRKLAEAATPGPWDVIQGGLVRAIKGELAVPIFRSEAPFDWHKKKIHTHAVMCAAYSDESNNAAFIAAAREALPALLAERTALIERAERADRSIQKVAMALGSSDEWTDQESMIADFEDRIKAALASRDKLAEAAEKVASEFECTIQSYHKIGPDLTCADGEFFYASAILDRENLIGELRAAYAIDGRAREPEWQPIESAPKDGTRILCTGGGCDGVQIAEYMTTIGAWGTETAILDDCDDEPDGYGRPTHWQHLPAASVEFCPICGGDCSAANPPVMNCPNGLPAAPAGGKDDE